MKTCVAILTGLTLACSSARADSWGLDSEVKDTEFTFGDTRIVLHYDSTRDQHFPEYSLGIYLKGKLVGKHDGVGFERVFASPDNAYFLGVSNSGLIKHAFVIFDRNGRMLKKQPHDLRKVHYSTLSKTLIRRWYDAEKPGVRFTVDRGELKDLRISACDGSRVSLLVREDLSLRRFLLEDLLKTHAKPNEICYVSFGTEPSDGKGATVRCNPPEQFLARFKSRPYEVKPVSDYPRPKGNEPWPPNNPKTGVPDGIYTVEIVQWLDDNTAKVKLSMYRDGLWARGEELIVERQQGQWRIKKHGSVWAA